jgi:hypothetical protein
MSALSITRTGLTVPTISFQVTDGGVPVKNVLTVQRISMKVGWISIGAESEAFETRQELAFYGQNLTYQIGLDCLVPRHSQT